MTLVTLFLAAKKIVLLNVRRLTWNGVTSADWTYVNAVEKSHTGGIFDDSTYLEVPRRTLFSHYLHFFLSSLAQLVVGT